MFRSPSRLLMNNLLRLPHIGIDTRRPAQVRPVDIRAQPLANHGAIRLALKIDAKAFAERLLLAQGFSEVVKGRAAASGVHRLFARRQGIEVSAKLVHLSSLPMGK